MLLEELKKIEESLVDGKSHVKESLEIIRREIKLKTMDFVRNKEIKQDANKS